jgi:hypothetical protein
LVTATGQTLAGFNFPVSTRQQLDDFLVVKERLDGLVTGLAHLPPERLLPLRDLQARFNELLPRIKQWHATRVAQGPYSLERKKHKAQTRAQETLPAPTA